MHFSEKLVLWTKAYPLSKLIRSWRHAGALCQPSSSDIYNRTISVIIKKYIILNIIHYMFNIRDTGVVICGMI